MSWMRKAIAALVTIVGSAIVMVSADVNFADGLDGKEWTLLIAAVVANVGAVYGIPNSPP